MKLTYDDQTMLFGLVCGLVIGAILCGGIVDSWNTKFYERVLIQNGWGYKQTNLYGKVNFFIKEK